MKMEVFMFLGVVELLTNKQIGNSFEVQNILVSLVGDFRESLHIVD